MKLPRISIAGLLLVVALLAVILYCLLYATHQLASAALSITLAALTIGPLGIIYRKGESRAFWIGLTLCGWSYLLLSSAPWFKPRLITTKVLEWAYPRMIPLARQPTGFRSGTMSYTLLRPVLEGLTADGVAEGNRVTVSVKGVRDAAPIVVAEDASVASTSYSSGRGLGVTLIVDRKQYGGLNDAGFGNKQFILTPRQGGAASASPSAIPVEPEAFQDVGHSLIALLAALTGGLVGRIFFVMQDETERRTASAGREQVPP